MVEKHILPFNWRTELENTKMESIDNDFILLEKPIITSTFDYPFKIDVTTAIICLSGTMKGHVNTDYYVANAPCLFVIYPEQILQYESFSEDFSGLFIVMSKRFLNDLSLNTQESFATWLSVKQNACIPLEERSLKSMINYFNMMKECIQIKDNPYRMQIAINLTRAFFYGAGYYFHNLSETRVKTHNEELTEKFLNLVQTHYKQERSLNFYAEKMCLTPKHLAKVIKENSERSANDWINERVILVSKALLKSTNMTIQQISDELNFPSQSFFGKYFKRLTGISPREYKGK